MTYSDIILDIDGTIWNTTRIVAEGWNKAVREWQAKTAVNPAAITPVSLQQLQQEFGKPMNIIARDLWPQTTETERQELLDLCVKYEHEALNQCTTDLTYPTVTATIQKLYKENRCRFYIVSNCQKGYAEIVMQKTGIAGCISDYETFGNTGLTKGQNIRLLADRNKLSSPVYVGDTAGDQEASQEAGVDFVWAAYGFGKCTSYVKKLEEFCQIEAIVSRHK